MLRGSCPPEEYLKSGRAASIIGIPASVIWGYIDQKLGTNKTVKLFALLWTIMMLAAAGANVNGGYRNAFLLCTILSAIATIITSALKDKASDVSKSDHSHNIDGKRVAPLREQPFPIDKCPSIEL